MNDVTYWVAAIVVGVAIGILLANAMMAFLAQYPDRLKVAVWLGLAVICYAVIYVAFVAGWMTVGAQWLRGL